MKEVIAGFAVTGSVALAVAIMALASPDAAAHAVGLSRGAYVVRHGIDNVRVEGDLVFAASDAPLLTAGEEIATVSADDVACTPDPTDAAAPLGAVVESAEGDGLRVHLAWTCPVASRVILALPFLERAEAMGATHRHIASVGSMEELMFAGHDHLSLEVPPEMTINSAPTASPATPRSFGQFVLLGLRHVLGGADHLAFVLGLVLCGGGFRELVRVVTAFTIAHSTTLALATLGFVTPSARLVEPLVALSVLYIGVDGFLRQRARARGGEGAARKERPPWRIAFAFGLVHGLAFSDALRNLGLHGVAIARALVGFNSGVEVAQLAVVIVAVPVIQRLRRFDRAAPVLGFASVVIGIAGAIWFVLRLV